MPYSVVVSEPIGLLIGGAAGRYGAKIGKKLASDRGWPLFLGAALGALAAHYLAGAITKALINAGVWDLPGAAISVAGTTPMASTAHAIIEGIIALSPDLSNALNEAISDAVPSAVAQVTDEVKFGTTYLPDAPKENLIIAADKTGYPSVSDYVSGTNPKNPR